MKENLCLIKEYLSHTEDLLEKELVFDKKKCFLLYIDSLVMKEMIQDHIIKPLLENDSGNLERIIKVTEVKKHFEISNLGDSLLSGSCIILLENEIYALIATVQSTEGRSIQEPENEHVIQGPRDGFVESLNTNIQLLRRRVKSPQFKVTFFTAGEITNTKIAMIYLENLVNIKLISEVKKRLKTINVDQIHSSGNIEELIEDNPISPFAQMLNTERPDRASSYLTDGKIVLIIDGDPRVLVIPISFFAFYQSPDDYTSRWMIGSFFRLVRIFSIIITMILPAIYIAIVSFHSEILPIGLLYSIRVSLEYLPLPPIVEAVAMLIILELLKEATIRLPSPIAQTIGIVGGLVIGTAVVEAHLVSNIMIVVIGLTAIASFIAPVNEMGTTLRLLSFPIMLFASFFGFFGIVITLMIIVMHLCKLESFGMPYFSPLAPFRKEDMKDTFIRLPFWKLNSRQTDAEPIKKQSISRVWKRNGK
ncbi:MAG: spore germination protein [Bacillota bacterium]